MTRSLATPVGEPAAARHFRTVSAVLSACVAALGVTVLAGWELGIEQLTTLVPASTATMKPNTALMFIIIGVGLWLTRSQVPRRVLIRRLAGAAVAVLAALTLLEHILETDLHIDGVLVPGPHPGRMSFASAASFILLGVALILHNGRGSTVSRTSSVVAALVAAVALFGYSFDATALYALGPQSVMALHTAVGFVLSACAFLTAYPDEGLIGLLISDGEAGRLLRRLLPAILLTPPIIGWVELVGERAGYFDLDVGAALTSLSTLVALAVVSTVIASSLHRSELSRGESEAGRQALIEEMKRAQRDLKAGEATRQQQLTEIVENAPHAIAMLDRDMRYLKASPRWIHDFGLTGPIIGKSHYDVFPALPEKYKEGHRRCLAGAIEQHDDERFVRNDGTVQWLRWKVCPWRDLDGAIGGLLIYTEDVTTLRSAIESARDLARHLEDRVAERTQEVAVLLKEIHHRVKNNLQVISSLFYLQEQRTEHEAVRKLLDESRSRLQSIALVHDKLYRSERLASVDFGDYLRDLTASVMSAIGVPRIQVRIDTDPIFLDIDRAIPCALLMNELLSNALKHAFPGERQGEIHVCVRIEGREIQLEVSDTGIGFPQDLDFTKVATLGLQLVVTLAKQLRGTVELRRDAGTTFTVHFPAYPAEPRARPTADAHPS